MAPKKYADAEGVSPKEAILPTPNHAKTSFEGLCFRFNRADVLTLVEQIVRQIALFLDAQVLHPGERLPPVDVAARHVGVGKRAMGFAYQLLASHGITNNSNGLGTIFTSGARLAARRYLLSTIADALVHQAQALELGEEDVVAVVLTALSRQSGKHNNVSEKGHVTEP